MRDRLIELLKTIPHGVATFGDFAENLYIENVMTKHLLENGVIVPPMNIGQQCFILGYDFGECKECVKECRVSCVTQKKNGSFAIRISETKYSATHNFTPDDIGKTVFLTKEEAEQVLKGGEG